MNCWTTHDLPTPEWCDLYLYLRWLWIWISNGNSSILILSHVYYEIIMTKMSEMSGFLLWSISFISFLSRSISCLLELNSLILKDAYWDLSLEVSNCIELQRDSVTGGFHYLSLCFYENCWCFHNQKNLEHFKAKAALFQGHLSKFLFSPSQYLFAFDGDFQKDVNCSS